MNNFNFFIIVMSFLFFILLFYFIYISSSKVVKFRVTKEKIDNKGLNIDYDKLKNKYIINDCNKKCKQEICDDYQVQKIKYDLCKNCSKKMMCYDPLEGICKFCLNFNSCEKQFGCMNDEPINPLKNYCLKCW
jgi:hypothetical protein